jgi:hypothetical protein
LIIEKLSAKFGRKSTSLNRAWKYCEGKVPVNVIQKVSKRIEVKKTKEISILFVGPTVEGPDAEYVKVVSGKVVKRKPSFA